MKPTRWQKQLASEKQERARFYRAEIAKCKDQCVEILDGIINRPDPAQMDFWTTQGQAVLRNLKAAERDLENL